MTTALSRLWDRAPNAFPVFFSQSAYSVIHNTCQSLLATEWSAQQSAAVYQEMWSGAVACRATLTHTCLRACVSTILF